MATQVIRRRFTVNEYNLMARAGILHEDDRVELLEGEIVEMAAIGSRHAACVKRLNRILSEGLGEPRHHQRVQDPCPARGTLGATAGPDLASAPVPTFTRIPTRNPPT